MEAGIGAVTNSAVANAQSEQDQSEDTEATYKSQLTSKNLEITALGVHEQRITNLVVCLDILRHLRQNAEQVEKRQTGTAYANAPMCQLSCAEVNGVLLDSPSSVVRLLLQRLEEACQVTLSPLTIQALRHAVGKAADKAGKTKLDDVGYAPISIEVGCSLTDDVRRLFCAQTLDEGSSEGGDSLCLSSAMELVRANMKVDAVNAAVDEGQADAAQQPNKRETEALKPADALKNVSPDGGGMTFILIGKFLLIPHTPHHIACSNHAMLLRLSL